MAAIPELSDIKIDSRLGVPVTHTELRTIEYRQYQHPTEGIGKKPEGIIAAPAETLYVEITSDHQVRTVPTSIYGTHRETQALPQADIYLTPYNQTVLAELRRHSKYITALDPIILVGNPHLEKKGKLPKFLNSLRGTILSTEDARTAAALFIVQLHLLNKTAPRLTTWNSDHYAKLSTVGEPFNPETTDSWYKFYKRNGLDYIDNGDEVLTLVLTKHDSKPHLLCNYELMPAAATEDRGFLPPGGALEPGEIKIKGMAREVMEELGGEIDQSSIAELGTIYAWPERQTAASHIYFCKGTLGGTRAQGDETTEIYPGLLSMKQLKNMLLSGEINDARFVAMLGKTYNRGLLPLFK